MKNGLYVVSTKQFVELESRGQLKDDEPQRILRENYRNPENVVCGCSLEAELKRFQKPVKSPGGGFTCRRLDGVHPRGCFSNRPGDGKESQQVRSVAILEPIKVRDVPAAVRNEPSSSSNRDVYDTFSKFGYKVLSLGTTDACREIAVRLADLRNPSAAEVFEGIERAVRKLTFSNGGNAFELAASRGDRLRFGLIYDPVISDGTPVDSLTVYWWRSGDTYVVRKAAVDPLAMARATADLQIYKNHQAPPYFILAVETPKGLLTRVFLHQVAVDKTYLIPTESGAEAVYASQLACSNHALLIIKSVLKKHLPDLLESLGIKLIGFEKWPFRPDFIVLWKGKNGLILCIRELRGKKPGIDPDYDIRFEANIRIAQELKATVAVEAQEVDGTGLVWSTPLDGPESWRSAYVTMDQIGGVGGETNPGLPPNADHAPDKGP